MDYFSENDESAVARGGLQREPIIVTDRMPLVLQHKGHSRTIVGYEMTKNGAINLLAFDPSKCLRAVLPSLLSTTDRSAPSPDPYQTISTVSHSHGSLVPLRPRACSVRAVTRKADPNAR